ncbi:MAG TPA: hypothetical protein VH116_04765, partial [Gemmatimonadales bacterium]|nr:hypothetical protein [Gemmatimonadales bacterium]
MKLGVPKETAVHERRVALVPESVAKLVRAGWGVVVEQGAGSGAALSDAAYREAGAELGPDARAVYAAADVVAKVQRPSPDEAAVLRAGTGLISLLQPARVPELVHE